MATSNPFDELSVFLPPLVVQVFIALMIIAFSRGSARRQAASGQHFFN
jgi:uncharacterized membrane protein YbaN (DUF454 family)